MTFNCLKILILHLTYLNISLNSSCSLSSCEDLLPLEISQALMEVMCQHLQNILRSFHQQQTSERGETEETDVHVDIKSSNTLGVLHLNVLIECCTSILKGN